METLLMLTSSFFLSTDTDTGILENAFLIKITAIMSHHAVYSTQLLLMRYGKSYFI